MGEGFVEKAAEDLERVIRYGDDEVRVEDALKTFHIEGKMSKRKLLRTVVGTLWKKFPENTRAKIREDTLKNVPVAKSLENAGYKTLTHLGSGYEASVYLVDTNPDGKSYVVEINRKGFDLVEEAQQQALSQKRDAEKIKEIFSNMEGFVPDEEQVLVQLYNGRPSILYFRELTPGELQDVFMTDRNDLIRQIRGNSKLRTQFEQFLDAIETNKEFVIKERLDLLGEGNLVLIGNEDEKKLRLVEPHTIEDKENTPKSVISKRIEYIEEIVKKANQ